MYKLIEKVVLDSLIFFHIYVSYNVFYVNYIILNAFDFIPMVKIIRVSTQATNGLRYHNFINTETLEKSHCAGTSKRLF